MTNYLTLTTVVFLFGFLGHTTSQEDMPATEDGLRIISNILDSNNLNISANTDLNTQLNSSVMQTADEVKNVFKQKCDKNGGPGTYENVQNAKDHLEQCLKSFVNITELKQEMEINKPVGNLDMVFKKYCQKTPVLKKCINDFTTALEPCMEPAERENKKIVQNITDSLLNFVCYKEGDRIALFISANGPECLQSKQQEIQNCTTTIFNNYIPPLNFNNGSVSGLDSLPSLVLENKECNDIFSLQNCVVQELEKCSDPTPANIVDSIFRFILRETPCRNVMGLYQNAASIPITSWMVIIIEVCMLISIT